VLISAASFAAGSSTAFPCGYEDPTSVSGQRGVLNLAYPKALYVMTAVWQAQQEGLIGREHAPVGSKAALLGAGYRAAVARLGRLRERLSDAAGGGNIPAFSIVLLGPMLWSRYEYSVAGLAMKAHSGGPSEGDVVIVTDEPVIAALVEGRMTASMAREHGLMRFYGPAGNVVELTSLFDGLSLRQGTVGLTQTGAPDIN
jgi:hypothetical protein